ncbi:MAG: hypothetical protein ACM3KR_07565 [Deltaproteobacteria bacterium]
MDAYLYIPSNEKTDALMCGIKLSSKADKTVEIKGYPTQCISALLNPRDDIKKYKSSAFSCLRIDVSSESCYIADKSLYGNKDLKELYSKTIIPPKDYIFGTYRNPECLIPRTILPENLSDADKPLGSPLLYQSSEELYINNLLENFREKYPDFNETILSLFIELNQKDWKLKRTINKDLLIFSNQEDDDSTYFTIHT